MNIDQTFILICVGMMKLLEHFFALEICSWKGPLVIVEKREWRRNKYCVCCFNRPLMFASLCV